MNKLNKEFINYLIDKYSKNENLEKFMLNLEKIKSEIGLELLNRKRKCLCLNCCRELFAGNMKRQNSRYCFRCDND